MRNLKITLLLFALVFSFFTKAQGKVENEKYNNMLKGLLEHNVTEVNVNEVDVTSVLFLDARELVEYNVSHIKGAVWVGYDDFDLSRVKKINKTAKVVVYCSVGYRSEKVTQKLKAAGFTSVSNLYGGIFEWVNEDKSVVNVKNQNTQKVHAFDEKWGVWLLKGVKVY
jgi:rhodanese-related sulfurtransferase